MKKSVVLAIVLAISGAMTVAEGALIVTEDVKSTGDQLVYAGTVLANDLVDISQATLASISTDGFVNWNGYGKEVLSPDYILNDGAHGAQTMYPTVYEGAFDADTFSVTYALDTVSSPLGYDLTRIRAYSAAGDGRAGLNFEVFVDLVGGAENFVSVGSFYSERPGGPTTANQAHRMTLENDLNPGTDAFATGVAAIRFDIGQAPVQDVWREIDVEGVALGGGGDDGGAIPEPATLALVALGAVGLVMRRK